MTEINPILVEVSRGKSVESFHRGAAVAVKDNGEIFAFSGNPRLCTFIRSSAKPFQVLPLLISGAAEKFGFTEEEIALMCGSHSGTETHTRNIAGILRKIGLSEKDLKCGIHPPLDQQTRNSLAESGKKFTQLHNNCSGKHAAMLAGSIFRGYAIDDYLNPGHPWQKEILKILSLLAGIPIENITVGVDGCGAPVHSLPLYNAALAAARLVKPSEDNSKTAEACRGVIRAMTEFPEMVGGEGRICTDLIKSTHGKIIGKAGAEGFYLAFWLKDSVGYGLALKIDDGAERAREPVLLECLKQLGALTPEEADSLETHRKRKIVNHAGLEVGEIRTVFQMQFSEV